MKRRQFFKKCAALTTGAAIFPSIIPASALGKNGAVAPSDRINMGWIGTGNNGINWLRTFLQEKNIQVVAVCDVNKESDGYWNNTVRGREVARKITEEHYAGLAPSGFYKGCDAYEDFRDVLRRKDIDAVYNGTPDHWHSIIVTEAAKAGKDIYGQKPLSLTIAEGRAMVNAVNKHGVIFQTGSQQRSDYNFRRICELVQNGRIGTLHTVTCGLPGGVPDLNSYGAATTPVPVPKGFNYDLWLGPAPEAPYSPARCHVNFRWNLDYSGGQVTDWGGHHPDIAQWGMGTEKTGPIKIQNARATWADHPIWNTATDYYFECLYKNGVKLIISTEARAGVTFEGTDGWVWANRGRHETFPETLRYDNIGPEEIHLYASNHHVRNFIDCVLNRQQPVAPIEVGHRSISIAHLGNIAMKLQRDLEWDPDKERFINDAQADRLLSRPMRSPWHVS